MLRKERPRIKNGERAHLDQVKQHVSPPHLIPGALVFRAMLSSPQRPSYLQNGTRSGDRNREKARKKKKERDRDWSLSYRNTYKHINFLCMWQHPPL